MTSEELTVKMEALIAKANENGFFMFCAACSYKTNIDMSGVNIENFRGCGDSQAFYGSIVALSNGNKNTAKYISVLAETAIDGVDVETVMKGEADEI